MNPRTFDDLMHAVLEILPNAELGEDFDGQIIIYTNLRELGDTGAIVVMDE